MTKLILFLTFKVKNMYEYINIREMEVVITEVCNRCCCWFSDIKHATNIFDAFSDMMKILGRI